MDNSIEAAGRPRPDHRIEVRMSLPTVCESPATVSQLAQSLQRAGIDMAILTVEWTGTAMVAAHPLMEYQLRTNGNHCRLQLRAGGSADFQVEEQALSYRAGIEVLFDRMEMSADAAHRMPDGVGWIGYVGYEAGRGMELPPLHRVDMPARFIFYRDYYICTAPGHWLLITAAVGETGRRISDEMRDQLEAAATERIGPAANARLLSTPNGQDYVSAVRRVLDYIAAGDIYQMNLTRRWMGSTDDPLAFWRQMCEANPGRYSAYLQTGNQAICCTSPELFLARDGRTLVTCPIKGTRRRHRQDSNLDRREADALLSSEKELAELTMITDLLRNDLGRVCDIGSVRIAERRKLEALPSVWQTYAVIHGSTGLNWGAILAGMLPGGSITGVPKKRAMEIIDELEPCERGVYCGNIGWIGPGKGCLNIAIRTAIWESGTFHYAAGAGIVADSDPEAEFAEIAAKACAVTELCRG